MARGDSGTSCSRFDFVRSAGTFHTAAPKSISVQCARRTSPERAAVNTRNSNASFAAVVAREAWIVSSASATSAWGNAAMCRTISRCRPSVAPTLSHGLSVRYSIATAHCITVLMRWRRRRAVSGL